MQPIHQKKFNPLCIHHPNLSFNRECNVSTVLFESVLTKSTQRKKNGSVVYAFWKLNAVENTQKEKNEGKCRFGDVWKRGWEHVDKYKENGVYLLTFGIIVCVDLWLRRRTCLVPYSFFIDKLCSREVEKVVIDGDSLRFELKRGVVSDVKKMINVYNTKRPKDAKTPYREMHEHGVEFGSHDYELYSRLLNYVLIASLSVTVLKCLPIKFLQQKRSETQKRNNDDSGDNSIKFSDVCGVDEAKEELQEIVVWLNLVVSPKELADFVKGTQDEFR